METTKNPHYDILLPPDNCVIGISGWPGCGKDTLASYFVRFCSRFTRCSLADLIREVAVVATGLSYKRLFEHPGKDEPVASFGNKTPRELTIEIGKGVEFALGYHIWHQRLEQKIYAEGLTNVVVPDIRTPFQAQWVKDHARGFLIRIESQRETYSPIECMLDNYGDFDIVVSKDDWFEHPELIFERICKKIGVEIVDSVTHRKGDQDGGEQPGN